MAAFRAPGASLHIPGSTNNFGAVAIVAIECYGKFCKNLEKY